VQGVVRQGTVKRILVETGFKWKKPVSDFLKNRGDPEGRGLPDYRIAIDIGQI
jgi:hypothetical protein